MGGDLLEAIRINIGNFVDSKTRFAGYSSDGSDRRKWESAYPKGVIMSFDALFEDPLVGYKKWNLDDASVITSSYMKNTSGGFWTFSTITTAGDGFHPIGGTRQFGVSSVTGKDGSLSYIFYIRAADRAYGLIEAKLQKTVFSSEEETWNGVMNNVYNWVNENGGSSLVPFTPISKRVHWKSIEEQLK